MATVDAAFTLNRLDNQGTHSFAELRFQIVDVVELHKAEARYQRLIRFPVLIRCSGRQCAIGAAVKSIVEGEHLMFACTKPVLITIAASQLDGRFNGFSAAVAKKDFFQPRELDQFPGKQSLVGVVEEIAHMK